MGGIYDPALEVIRRGRRFLTVSHVNPEGDAVGSLLGITLALRGLGKEVVAYLEDPVPETYGFLPGASTVVHSLDGEGPFDATFAVDCGQKERLGDGFNALEEPGCIVNLDHHATNDRFGDVNVVLPDASAAGEIVYDLCRAGSIEIDAEVATNLYVAIHTDTGSFRYSSATADSFIKAGELVRCGARPWEISMRVYEDHPATRYHLLARVLSTLDVIDGAAAGGAGSIATLLVTREMFAAAGAEKDVADGFVNYARGIRGVEVGILFRENAPGDYKVSMRSKGLVDVAAVAGGFGGGGHRNAAGCNVNGSFEEVKARVISAVRERISHGAA